MIRLADTALLALTKLRTRKIRTMITVLLASLLFGVMVAVSLVTTGAFQSLDNFRADGLTSRYIVSVMPPYSGNMPVFVLSDPTLVSEAKQRYEKLVEEKKAEAESLGIAYSQAVDPPPYEQLDDGSYRLTYTGRGSIGYEVIAEKYGNRPVIDNANLFATAERYHAIQMFISARHHVKITSTLEAYADRAELFYDQSDIAEANNASSHQSLLNSAAIMLAPPEITSQFMLPDDAGWQPNDGLLPIVVSQDTAEKLLDLAPLLDQASAQDKLDRLEQTRREATRLTFQACYRNNASNELIQQTIRQQKELKLHADDADYVKPAVIYELPDPKTCENPRVVADTRTPEQKQHEENQFIFDAKYAGKARPISYFVDFKVVGVSPAVNDGVSMQRQVRSLGDVVENLLATSGVGQVIPQELYDQLPDKEKYVDVLTFMPTYMFGPEDNEQRFVEFPTAADAQRFIDETSCVRQPDGACLAPEGVGQAYQAAFYFSNSSAIEDIRGQALQWSIYAMLGVIVLAAVVMWVTIGRTIADGRRETAVFRAIGFKRVDIVGVYVLYTVVLSVLVAVCALGIGVAAAYCVDQAFAPGLTVQAQYSFGGLDLAKRVTLMGVDWRQLGLIMLACLATGMLSMVMPLVRNVRRSPIRDMREE
jgi:hypothetical protein